MCVPTGGTLGIKIDVDTLVGYRKGVPSLLAQLDSVGAQATFFFAAGPDRSGLAVRRLFTQRGFLGKMIRNRAASTFGLRTMLQGTLLPAPLIVASDPGIVGQVVAAGHEVGVHGWDHVTWHDYLGRMSGAKVDEHLSRAFDTIGDAAGAMPNCFAAPGWQCSPESIAWQDARKLAYASDVRGPARPFRPRIGERVFATVQIPTSLPTLDEMMGPDVPDGPAAANAWSDLLTAGLNVLTAHAEIEGMAVQDALTPFLRSAASRGIKASSLGQIAQSIDPSTLPVVGIAPGHVEGRCGQVWCAEIHE